MGNYPQTRESAAMPVAPIFNANAKGFELIKSIAGHCWHGKGDMIDRVYDAVALHYPHWTRRRVRGIYHKEAAKVGWSEIRELEYIEALAKQARAAREEHNEFLRRIESAMDRMEMEDAEFYQAQRDALSRMARGTVEPARVNDSGEGNEMAAMGGANFGAAE